MSVNAIEGNPTKQFFIEMITRDISIEDAIIDLLDNSIDGANRINATDYSGLKIELFINDREFIIKDNCGGFSLDTAQKYAFRFGRPEGAPLAQNAVGRFGIGMKRSLFKIGRKFSVESQYKDDHFKVEVDVDTWSHQSKVITTGDGDNENVDDWSFSYISITDEQLDQDGTIIEVRDLNPEVKDLFGDNSFLVTLSNDIRKILNFSLQKNIEISLNGQILGSHSIELLMSDQLLPYYHDGRIGDVKYRLIAGLGEHGDPSVAGWYIICNNRMVVEADKTSLTCWGVNSVPKWHNDYVMFRGLLFLDSEETMSLPLTTTKKGVDATSEVYKTLMPLMKDSMLRVISFLKMIARLGNEGNNYRDRLSGINHITAVKLKCYPFSHEMRSFISPDLDPDSILAEREMVRIGFDAKKTIADIAKYHAEARSYKELGQTMFDYYLKMENIKYEESDSSEL